MVSIKTLLVSTVLLTSSAFARIRSIDFPDTAQAGQNVTATLHNLGDLSNWDDFGVVWGLKGQDYGLQESSIGRRIGWDNLFPDYAGVRPNYTLSVNIPQGTDAGDYILTAAIPYLVGAGGSTHFNYFTHNITVTDAE